MAKCDCERGHNGFGLMLRECDCREPEPERAHRAYAISLSFRSPDYPSGDHEDQAAIGNMDGSWWIDWDRLAAMRTYEINNQSAKPNAEAQYIIMLIDLLCFARGRGLREVPWERCDEIAQEYGARMETNIDMKVNETDATS
jgi:hypothetical protein